MPTPGQELSSIDFESLIGGPLVAMIHAQAQAAITTVDFVKSVAFKPIPNNPQKPDEQRVGEPINVDFLYPKEISPYNPGNPNANPPIPPQPAVYEEEKLSVPLLTMLPIPSLRIEEGNIDFLAKIDSTEYTKTDTSVNVDVEAEGSVGWAFGSVKIKASVAYQRQNEQGQNTTRSYSMHVAVKVVQDEMPAGMAKVLSILEAAIQSQPVSAPPAVNKSSLNPELPIATALRRYVQENRGALNPAPTVVSRAAELAPERDGRRSEEAGEIRGIDENPSGD